MTAESFAVDAPGSYPIVLSDELLGKTAQDTYTTIRYNHKPDPASDSSLSSLQLQPSISNPANYNLSFSDDSGKYKYNGIRATSDGQYVLIFDPEKKHFVLHRIDSTFNMNLVSAPWETNTSTLQSQYSQLDSTGDSQSERTPRKLPKASSTAAVAKSEPKRPKATPAKKRAPIREPSPEEEDGSDDGLTIEYPDAPNPQQSKPEFTPSSHRNVSEEISDEDADGEDDDSQLQNKDIDPLKLPSPANNATGGMSDDSMELDLEAELEQALQETAEGPADDESDESEEE